MMSGHRYVLAIKVEARSFFFSTVSPEVQVLREHVPARGKENPRNLRNNDHHERVSKYFYFEGV